MLEKQTCSIFFSIKYLHQGEESESRVTVKHNLLTPTDPAEHVYPKFRLRCSEYSRWIKDKAW